MNREIRKFQAALNRRFRQNASTAKTELLFVLGSILFGMLCVFCFCSLKPEIILVAPVSEWKTHLSSDLGERQNPTGNGTQYHQGIDFAVAEGENICCAAEGVVVKAKEDLTGYGYHLIIQHKNGWQTLYAHCSELLVKEGDSVKAGEVIALSGSTGDSTGPHLHFELSQNGEMKDAKKYMK